jgi:hypothetical protein
MLAAIRLQYPQSLPWVTVLIAFFAVGVFMAYSAQLRRVPPRLRWLLPAVRLLAASAIALSILRPVVTRQRSATERAPVIILFDNSKSMSVIDAAPAELVGIAEAMAKLPTGAGDQQTEALQNECDLLSIRADDVFRCRAELDYARLAGRGQETAQQRLDQAIDELRTTASKASAYASDILGSPTAQGSTSATQPRGPTSRASAPEGLALERLLALLARLPTATDLQNWLDHLRDRARRAAVLAEQVRTAHDAELYLTDPQVRSACQPLLNLSRLRLAESVAFDPAAGLIGKIGPAVQALGISDRVSPISARLGDEPTLVADGSLSNITGGIKAVLDSLGASPPRAVILFSDGRQTGADVDLTAALQGVPIFTVDTATRSGIRDQTIVLAALPSVAAAGEVIPVKAEVRGFGCNGVSSKLTITGGGAADSRTITYTDDRPITFVFTRRFDSAGVFPIRLELSPVTSELSYDNNTVERWVRIQPPGAGNAVKNPPPATRPVLETEMQDLTGDEPALRRLAERSGGQFFRLDQLGLLATRVSDLHDDITRPVEMPLWDGSYLVCVVIGCLTVEWGLRKRWGLA